MLVLAPLLMVAMTIYTKLAVGAGKNSKKAYEEAGNVSVQIKNYNSGS